MLTATDVLGVVWGHAEGCLDREVGGVLLGTITEAGAEIEVALPALKADGHRTHVTFTHEVWEEIHQIVDRDHPGRRIVGWYHSHPGFGIFLSEYDLFIQRNFFSGEHQVALVVDPHAGTLGWFGWEAGEVTLFREDGPFPEHAHLAEASRGDAIVRTTAGRRAWPAVAAALTVGVIGGALLGGVLTTAPPSEGDADVAAGYVGVETTDGAVADTRAQLEEASAALQDARAELERMATEAEVLSADLAEAENEAASVGARVAELEAQLNDSAEADAVRMTIRVLRGDTLGALALRLYGDLIGIDRLLEANPGLTDPDQLLVDQVLVVPTGVES